MHDLKEEHYTSKHLATTLRTKVHREREKKQSKKKTKRAMIKESQLKDLNAFECRKIDLDETGIINIGTGCWLILFIGRGICYCIVRYQFSFSFTLCDSQWSSSSKDNSIWLPIRTALWSAFQIVRFWISLKCSCVFVGDEKQCYVLKACLLTFSVH